MANEQVLESLKVKINKLESTRDRLNNLESEIREAINATECAIDGLRECIDALSDTV